MKRFINEVTTVFVSIITILCFAFYWHYKKQNDISSRTITVGFVYEGDESTPYTNNFIIAQHEMEKQFGDRVKVIAISNVPTDNCTETLEFLVQSGSAIIFTNSYGYSTHAKEFAQKYPDIQFCSATGDNAMQEPVLPNFHNFMGEIYQGRYVAGIVAGLKLNELVDENIITKEQAKIGYVAAFPFAEVISGYTAFLLGALSVAPYAVMHVRYANTWNSYPVEKEYAKRFIEDGCVIISQHSDSIAPAVACEEAYSTHTVYHVGYNQSMLDIAPVTSLVSTKINWIPYITGAVQAVLMQKPIEKTIKGHIHKNDISAGFEEDWVQILELNETIVAPGTQELVNKTVKAFKDGKAKVFYGDYTGINPYNPDDKCNLTTEYIENKSRSSPSFCYILDGKVIQEE